ncbi:TonB-dependent receptor domain-containing protein [Longitalea luteola]|uniref:TonB-dependent receptor domain-containing protein n=1 Tax=Longitalea luteola TaxID=2812563 RepID=UPI001A96F4D6|nr:TonB-dependent receptor [Longitalea luteola]
MRTLPNLFAIILLSVSLVGRAQNKTEYKLSGKVGTASQSVLSAATVTLLRAKDSSVVKMSVSDQDGRYSFNNPPQGRYLIAVSAVGYEKQYSTPFTLSPDNPAIELTPIILIQRTRDLKAVTVSARKPLVEQKIDRTVVNVDAFISNTGANALEALEKSPGIQVDKDGNISLKGKQNVVVLIDGRPAYLSGADLANMLKGMQASQLEQIEIMTNPPARFDAAGNAGVINIKTKKNKVKGFNGNMSAGVSQGVYFKTNESLSLNYRNGKVNVFSNYSFNLNNNFQQLEIFRRYKDDDGSTNAIFEQVAYMKRRNMSNNLKMGMDYYLTGKTTLGVVFSGFYNPESSRNTNTSYLQDPDYALDSIATAGSHIKGTWKNASVNLNMRHQFDSTGRELTADLDYIVYDNENNQQFLNTTYEPNWIKRYEEQLQGVLPVTVNIYSAKMDYTHPLKKNGKIEAGWKSSYVQTENKANYYLYDGSEWMTDLEKTNYFDYNENINAAYISLNKQITKKWGLQTGLRFENTNYKGHQFGNPAKGDSSFKRTYNSLFPTVYISYAANEHNQFGINYGRRIDRPGYQNLNPFMFFIDKFTYVAGNPYLRPQYSNNFELTHIYKGKLTTTLNYSITENLFNETFDQLGYATVVRQGNIGRRENAGISVNANVPVTKWLTSILYTNYNYTRYSGQLYGEELKVEAGNLLISLNNQLNFNKGWGAELSGWYRSKGVEGQILLMPMGQMAAGISKQVLKGQGSVKVNVRDIFYTQIPNGDINFKNTEAWFRNTRDTRVVNLTFSYRFGKPIKSTNGQRKKGGANDEQNRVNIGN